MPEDRYAVPASFDGLSAATLRKLSAEDKRDFMRAWFRENYDPPEENTPYDSDEGGYLWIWGGPYDPREELEAQFGGVISDSLIADVTAELEAESYEWTKKPVYDDYDDDLLSATRSNVSPLKTLRDALDTIKALLNVSTTPDLAAQMYRLLFANVVASLETYLCDTFLNHILDDRQLLARFVETNPDFANETVPYSKILSAAEAVEEKVKGYLLDVVWHNMAKVQAMFNAALDIKFGKHLGPVAKAIPTRHDVVHRNGKSKDGKVVVVGHDDVSSLIESVLALATHVEEELKARRALRVEADRVF